MKFVFLFFIVLLISNNSYTQSYFYSGLFNVSGEATISYSNSEQEYIGKITQTEIKFAPAGSYFIIDKLSIGIELSYNYFEKKSDGPVDIKDIEMFLGFGPVIKYYFLDNNLSPFVKAGYSHNIFNITDSYFKTRKSFPGFSTAIGVGVNYFITNSLALESSLDYVYSQKQIEIYDTNSSVFLNSNKKTFSLSIGLSCFL